MGAFAAAITLAGLPTVASAQSLIDFLWGGSEEFGGGRQTVSFDKKYTPGQVIVSFGDRRLYHVTNVGQAVSYPIAVPREQSRWSGNTTVTMKKENPAWTPTPEMIRENPRLPRWVPGGHPMNPLGVRALYLGSSTYRIHGTDAPWTIGQAVSKGCIRMFNEDVLHLYPKIPVGTKVTVTWNRFKTGEAVASAEAAKPESAATEKTTSSASAFSDFFGTGPAFSAPPERRVIKTRAKPLSAPKERHAEAE
jgi:lipoprotein-anchoring transpeptidase ErfK/SrfK